MTDGIRVIGVRKKRWTVCFDNDLLDMNLTIYQKMIYVVLSSYASRDGTCYPSIQAIADKASCSRAQVFNVLKSLEEIGLIQRQTRIEEGRGQTSNVYELVELPATAQDAESPVHDVDTPSPHDGHPPSTVWTPPVQDVDCLLDVFEQYQDNNTSEHTPSREREDESVPDSSGRETAKRPKRAKAAASPEEQSKIEEWWGKFWTHYPRKVDKKKAREAFDRVIARASPHERRVRRMEHIAVRLTRYLHDIETGGTEPRYIKHPATWLNAHDWDEEPGDDERLIETGFVGLVPWAWQKGGQNGDLQAVGS